MSYIQRLSDGEILALSESTSVFSAEGILDFKRTREFTNRSLGESVPLSSTIDQKTFSIDFFSTDESGADPRKISRFFSRDEGYFRIFYEELGVGYIDFMVIAVDLTPFNGDNGISITCQSKYGDLVDENKTTIYQATIASGAAFPLWNGSYTNNTQNVSSLRLRIEASSLATWKAGTVLKMTRGTSSVNSTIGLLNDNGVLSTWQGMRFTLDSYDEIVEGKGFISPNTSAFWRYFPGEGGAISVASFVNPLATAMATTVTIEAFSVAQKQD